LNLSSNASLTVTAVPNHSGAVIIT
jgi:hypothetical protein